MNNQLKVMIVAGEASGDLHAAKLVREARSAYSNGNIEFFGAAGPHMREMGVDPIVRSDNLSVVGLLEIARSLPIFVRAYKALMRAAATRRPDVVVLVDFPDFNLRLARSLKKAGFNVAYYISPQLWAWRQYRIGTVRKYVDLMITILPFEKGWYADRGLDNVEYVGSPLTREIHSDVAKEDFCRRYGLDPRKPVVSLLPGSRHKEIVRILPVMLEAASKTELSEPDIQYLVAMASGRRESEVSEAISMLNQKGRESPKSLTVIEGETYNALNASDAAAITSGTATLEAAIIGTPMAIVYKTSAVNYKLLRPLISVEHFGLVNLIAEKRIAKELIQDDFTPATLSAELVRLLEPSENVRARNELSEAVEKLGHGGASRRAAEAILKLVK